MLWFKPFSFDPVVGVAEGLFSSIKMQGLYLVGVGIPWKSNRTSGSTP